MSYIFYSGVTISPENVKEGVIKMKYELFRDQYTEDIINGNMQNLSHGKMAEKLCISSHLLTNFLRRTNALELWTSEKVGKNQYYM